VFWRNGACAAAGDESLAVERRACAPLVTQRVMAEAAVPAVPIREERYAVEPVPIGLYWLTGSPSDPVKER